VSELEVFQRLGVALSLGLLIGLERGWRRREEEEGERVAGLRTYGLIGLSGGIWALIAQHTGPVLVGFGFLGLVLVSTAAYLVGSRGREHIGITSIVASLMTFTLGALAMMGPPTIAAATAVVATLLLGFKPVLHDWVRRLELAELHATLKLLLISVVLLPVLPNQGYGPYGALNPYVLWWMVVLIAAVSYLGYFAIKIGGARHGALLTGAFGGLASSTAVTLSLARLTAHQRGGEDALAAGILAACATMFPRTLIVASAVEGTIFRALLPPIAVAAGAIYLGAYLLWRRAGGGEPVPRMGLQNPFQLGTALKFGLLLAAVLVLASALQSQIGDPGLYLLAAVSGISDVDAITLSLSQMAGIQVGVGVAARGILLAAAVNTVVKAGLALFVGGRALGLRVGATLIGAVAAGLVVAWSLPPQ
jgi:uncharacterized membrane protein (DUF4010 family)